MRLTERGEFFLGILVAFLLVLAAFFLLWMIGGQPT